LTRFSILGQNFDFWPKFRLLSTISIFDQNFDFCPKFIFFVYNFDFWPEFRFLTKIYIFCLQFRFLTRISIFDQNLYFLSTISISNQNCCDKLKFDFMWNEAFQSVPFTNYFVVYFIVISFIYCVGCKHILYYFYYGIGYVDTWSSSNDGDFNNYVIW